MTDNRGMTTAGISGGASLGWWQRFTADDDAVPSTRWQAGGDVLRRRPWLLDLALAAGVLLMALPQLAFWADQPEGLGVRLALTVALLLPLAARRRHPTAMFLFTCGIALVQWVLGVTLAADVVLLIHLATVASRHVLRVAVAAAAIVEAGLVLATLRWDFAASTGLPYAQTLLLLSAPVAAAFLLGVTVRARRQAVQALVDRARHLEREGEQRAALAVGEERTRIARELHDVVAHSLAVMVTMADAAALKLARDPEAARGAIVEVSRTGRSALDDMRRLLGVLRPSAATEVERDAPGVRQLPALADVAHASGLPVLLRVDVDPSQLPAALDLTVYRIVQESLTNVIKHATGASRIDVAVTVTGQELTVDVLDDGRSHGERPLDAPSGYGLTGMAERVALHGGTLQCGPRPGHGWKVSARLPLPSSANGPAV